LDDGPAEQARRHVRRGALHFPAHARRRHVVRLRHPRGEIDEAAGLLGEPGAEFERVVDGTIVRRQDHEMAARLQKRADPLDERITLR
jgi:hypothetical protein